MTHESFYLATMIEFTVWENGVEKTIQKFKDFDDLPVELHSELEKDCNNNTSGKKMDSLRNKSGSLSTWKRHACQSKTWDAQHSR